MIDPFPVDDMLSFSRAECPGQSKAARGEPQGISQLTWQSGGRWLSCSPREVHTEMSSELERLL